MYLELLLLLLSFANVFLVLIINVRTFSKLFSKQEIILFASGLDALFQNQSWFILTFIFAYELHLFIGV